MPRANPIATTTVPSIALTAKGKRYASRHAKALRSLARLREEAAAEIDRLMAFLDETDGDADLEPSLINWRDGGDDRELDESETEPSLAAPESVRTYEGPSGGWGPTGRWRNSEGSQLRWGQGSREDFEGDAREDDEDGHDREQDQTDLEPTCGWFEGVEQTRPFHNDWHDQ